MWVNFLILIGFVGKYQYSKKRLFSDLAVLHYYCCYYYHYYRDIYTTAQLSNSQQLTARLTTRSSVSNSNKGKRKRAHGRKADYLSLLLIPIPPLRFQIYRARASFRPLPTEKAQQQQQFQILTSKSLSTFFSYRPPTANPQTTITNHHTTHPLPGLESSSNPIKKFQI